MSAAFDATERHREQVQGFYNKDQQRHWVRDLTKPAETSEVWSAITDDYDAGHLRMLQAVERYRLRNTAPT